MRCHGPPSLAAQMQTICRHLSAEARHVRQQVSDWFSSFERLGCLMPRSLASSRWLLPATCRSSPTSKDLAAVLQSLEVSESTLERWRLKYGGMKAEEAVRLKKLEEENRRLKELVAESRSERPRLEMGRTCSTERLQAVR